VHSIGPGLFDNSRQRGNFDHTDFARESRMHIKALTKKLRATLQRQSETQLKSRIIDRSNLDRFSKSSIMASRLSISSTPIATALGMIPSRSHVVAVAAFFGGEFFLGRYAGNYFARPLLPFSRQHKAEVTALGLEVNRICLHCWHNLRHIHFEDEAHIVVDCPLYVAQRASLLREISAELRQSWCDAATSSARFQAIVCSAVPQDWKAIGSFLARVRQTRRRMKIGMQRKCQLRSIHNIRTVMQEWRKEGKHVCRHGVFFSAPASSIDCPCLQDGSSADWNGAVLMPALNEDLKCIVTDTFNAHCFQRLGVMQVTARRMNW
jgi:hypothetical protein